MASASTGTMRRERRMPPSLPDGTAGPWPPGSGRRFIRASDRAGSRHRHSDADLMCGACTRREQDDLTGPAPCLTCRANRSVTSIYAGHMRWDVVTGGDEGILRDGEEGEGK